MDKTDTDSESSSSETISNSANSSQQENKKVDTDKKCSRHASSEKTFPSADVPQQEENSRSSLSVSKETHDNEKDNEDTHIVKKPKGDEKCTPLITDAQGLSKALKVEASENKKEVRIVAFSQPPKSITSELVQVRTLVDDRQSVASSRSNEDKEAHKTDADLSTATGSTTNCQEPSHEILREEKATVIAVEVISNTLFMNRNNVSCSDEQSVEEEKGAKSTIVSSISISEAPAKKSSRNQNQNEPEARKNKDEDGQLKASVEASANQTIGNDKYENIENSEIHNICCKINNENKEQDEIISDTLVSKKRSERPNSRIRSRSRSHSRSAKRKHKRRSYSKEHRRSASLERRRIERKKRHAEQQEREAGRKAREDKEVSTPDGEELRLRRRSASVERRREARKKRHAEQENKVQGNEESKTGDQNNSAGTDKKHLENEEENDDAKIPDRQRRKVDLLTSRTGGAYIPPAKLRMLQAEFTDKSSVAYQRIAWEALKKSIHGYINKVNVVNIAIITRELLKENIVRGRGLLCRSIIQAQTASPTFTHVYAALVAIINSKFPNIGELLLKRLVATFKRAFRRNDKNVCMSSSRFIAHLVNQQVAHEILALEILTLLVETPTDDSVEVSIAFLKECGMKLTEVSSKGVGAIFEMLRNILHEGKLDKRVQYMIEVVFQVRKDGFKDHQAVIESLDLVEENDQFTHVIMLDDEINAEEGLNAFKFDDKYESNEDKYKGLSKEILGSDASDSSGTGSGSESDGSEDSEAEDEAKEDITTGDIIDNTETNLIALRRTIYLTINSSLDYEECAHKLMKMQLKPGQEIELCHMFLDCCAEQRTYEKFYGLLAQRFCVIDRIYVEPFEEIFKDTYQTTHRLDTNRTRNVSKFFAHLLFTDAISWDVFECVKLNEDDTTASSRIFLKILFQELAEYMGLANLNKRLKEEVLVESLAGLFPRDNPRNTRFAINFFTSIGLGGLTDELRQFLKNAPTSVPAINSEMLVNKIVNSSSSSSSSISSSSTSSSSTDSSSESSSSSTDSSSESSDSSSNAERKKKKKKVAKGKNKKKISKHKSNKNRKSKGLRNKRKRKNNSDSESECRSSADSSDSSKNGKKANKNSKKKKSEPIASKGKKLTHKKKGRRSSSVVSSRRDRSKNDYTDSNHVKVLRDDDKNHEKERKRKIEVLELRGETKTKRSRRSRSKDSREDYSTKGRQKITNKRGFEKARDDETHYEEWEQRERDYRRDPDIENDRNLNSDRERKNNRYSAKEKERNHERHTGKGYERNHGRNLEKISESDGYRRSEKTRENKDEWHAKRGRERHGDKYSDRESNIKQKLHTQSDHRHD